MIIFNLKKILLVKILLDPFEKTYHEVLLLLKILQIKPGIKKMNISYYGFFSVIKNRNDKEIVNDK